MKWIHGIAEKLERSFKKMVKNYLPNIPIVVPGSKYVLNQGNVPDTKGEKKTLQANLF